jgi:tetratricopeptide (TPR) repeat protein
MTLLQELLDRGDREGATAAATQILTARPTDGEALSALARLELEGGDVDGAKAHLERVGPRDRQRYEVLLAEAMVLQLSDQTDAARFAFAQLTATHATRPEAFFALGLAQLEKQDAVNAEKALATAVQLLPGHFLYRYRHAEALAQNGRFADAAQELTKTIELRPDFVRAYLAFARMLEANGQATQGLEILAAGLGSMPGTRPLLAEQLRIRLATGDPAALSKADLGIAEELVRANAHEAALEVCEHLEAEGKGSAKVSLLKALAYENTARTDEALEAYAKAMAQDPKDWSAANNRGLLLLEEYQDDAAKLAEAKATLEEAVRRAAGTVADPLLNLALLHGRQKEYAQGIALAKQVVAHPQAGALKAQAEKLVASMEKAAKSA